jgi:hypothetical protein
MAISKNVDQGWIQLGRALLVLLALAGMLILGGGLAHGMVALKGGRTLGTDSPNAARAEVGWPGMKITYVLPVLEDLDISPQFGFVYGHNLRADIVGFEPGVEIKWSFLQKGAWSMALVADPSILVWVPTDGSKGNVGLRIGGPGLVAGWQAASRLSLFGGIRAPMRTGLVPDQSFTIPVLGDLGAEMSFYQDEDVMVQGHAQLSLGPEFCFGGSCGDTEMGAQMTLGTSILW